MFSSRPVSRWASAGIILFAAFLLFVPGPSRQVESFGSRLFAPVQLGISGAVGAIDTFWNNMRRVGQIARENETYRVEVDRLEAELVRLRELELENEVLRGLLSLQQQTRPGELLPVRVIGSDVSPFVRSITIDRGADDGLREDMPVVTWKGLVGRVIRVNANSAKVLLITDVNSSVSVRVQDPGSRATGVARGRGTASLSLEHVPQQDHLEADQLVITSGLGGIFPDGLVVGVITEVIKNDYDVFQRATIKPAMDMNRIEHLYVILNSGE